jgi:hypothetical protein
MAYTHRLVAFAAVACLPALASCGDGSTGEDADAGDGVDLDVEADDGLPDVPGDTTDATGDTGGDPISDTTDATGDTGGDTTDATGDTGGDTVGDAADEITDTSEEDGPFDAPADEVEELDAVEDGADAADVASDELDAADGGDVVTDLSFDMPAEGTATLSGIVYCDPELVVEGDDDLDAVGHVLVALFDCQPYATLLCQREPLRLHQSGSPVDLGPSSTGYPYSFPDLPSGSYWVLAALDDDGSGFDELPWSGPPVDMGDPVGHPSPGAYLFTGSTVDDAHVTMNVRASRIAGEVTLDPLLWYEGDGIGDLHVGAADGDPSGGGAFLMYALGSQPAVDILDGAPDPYEAILLAPAGTVYVFAFLDDDGAGGVPATGDPSVIPAVETTLPSMGVEIVQDLVLDALVP